MIQIYWVQIRRKLRIWSHLLKKYLMENFIFFAVILSLADLESNFKPFHLVFPIHGKPK